MWIAGFFLTITVATTAAQGLLYNHSPWSNHSGFSGVEVVGQRREWADDFVLSTTVEIGEVRWYGGYYYGLADPANDAFVVRFFADNSGEPGQQLFEASAGKVPPIASGVILDFNIPGYVYRMNLDSPLRVDANQRYWISVVNSGNEFWEWQISDQNLTDGVLRRVGGGAWGEPYGDDAAFALYAVPEPKTVWFLWTGLLLLVGKFGRGATSFRHLERRSNIIVSQ